MDIQYVAVFDSVYRGIQMNIAQRLSDPASFVNKEKWKCPKIMFLYCIDIDYTWITFGLID